MSDRTLHHAANSGSLLAHGWYMVKEQMSAGTASSRMVLIVEDEQSIRDVLVELYSVPGNFVIAADSLQVALERLRQMRFDFIITDLRLEGKRDGGLQVMALAGMLSPDATVLVLTAFPDDGNRQASFRLGALHFLEKPVDLAVLTRLAADAGVSTAFDELPQVVS